MNSVQRDVNELHLCGITKDSAESLLASDSFRAQFESFCKNLMRLGYDGIDCLSSPSRSELHNALTYFHLVENENPIFCKTLNLFFGGSLSEAALDGCLGVF